MVAAVVIALVSYLALLFDFTLANMLITLAIFFVGVSIGVYLTHMDWYKSQWVKPPYPPPRE